MDARRFVNANELKHKTNFWVLLMSEALLRLRSENLGNSVFEQFNGCKHVFHLPDPSLRFIYSLHLLAILINRESFFKHLNEHLRRAHHFVKASVLNKARELSDDHPKRSHSVR